VALRRQLNKIWERGFIHHSTSERFVRDNASSIRSLNSRSYLDVYVVAKPRQRPQQLVKRAGRESSSKERRQICLWDLQQRSSLVDRETPTLEQPVDSSN